MYIVHFGHMENSAKGGRGGWTVVYKGQIHHEYSFKEGL